MPTNNLRITIGDLALELKHVETRKPTSNVGGHNKRSCTRDETSRSEQANGQRKGHNKGSFTTDEINRGEEIDE